MASSPSRDEEILQSQSLKRKRSASKDFSNDVNSDREEDEDEKATKCFIGNCDEAATQNSNSDAESNSPRTAEKAATKKRKYVFTTDNIAPKKCRKFYYIDESATKPRRPKVTKPVTVTETKVSTVPGRRHKLHYAKADNNGNLYLVHRLYHKSDLFFNDEKQYNYETFKKLDLAFHVVDEIALEGLDGITVEAFWKRLKNVFPNNINKFMADRIWRLICNNKRINFYILKEPREELIFFDRCKYLDIDTGMFVEPFIEFKDIYPLVSVNGTEIRGSCSAFNTRKENNGVRKFSMEKALKLYDQKLVFVADQTLRNKALINDEADPNIELLDVEYCMLEKIGRSRDQGEFTQGKMSLVNDSKKVYHNRKTLMQLSLIVRQTFCLKSYALQQNISGSVVHLSRFYHKRKTKQIAIMERIAQILKTKPNYQMEINEFRKIFGNNVSIVKLVKTAEFRRFFKISIFPYRKLYPNATKQEYLHKNKMKERQVRVLRMLDPYANVTVLMDSKEAKEIVREKTDSTPGRKLINYEYLRDVFLYILSTGTVGVTIQEIHDYFKTDFYSVRLAVRKLLLRNVISSSKIDLGRQQSLKFSAKCFSVPGCRVETQPQIHQLTDETLKKVLKGYDHITDSEFPPEPQVPNPAPVQTQFKLIFEPFCCTSFLTETIDPCSDELTIYDIVIKGRDKLLLIESNLFANYLSEWDDFLLKRDDFSKEVQLFQNGFGKVIYDFLTTIRLTENIETDNYIIFGINNLTPETRIGRQFQTHRVINIAKNYSNPHSDNYHIDTITKIYLFEAMFNENHKSSLCVEKLKHIFERVMVCDGKVKRKSGEVVKPELKIEVEVASNVGMEKFMGASPTLEWCGCEDDITIEIFASTKPARVMQPDTLFTAASNDVSLTPRYVNRANFILSTVYEKKIVQDVTTLYKDILKEEDEEGYDRKACKKSIVSIISKLVEDGYIKCYKVVMTGKNMTRTHCFMCVHDIDAHHGFIRSTIEQIKLRFYTAGPGTQKTITIKKKVESPFRSSDVRDSITELKQLTNVTTELKLKFDRAKGKAYGYAPKFVRMRVFHEHLFYVVREMAESEPLSSRQIFELCKNLKIKMSQNELSEMPPVYRNEVSWKMFIPALPQHTNWPKGWALACDIVLRMPLSVFVKLCNITFDVPQLDDFLNHPIKRHYLVKHLPTDLRNVLLYKRKYFHSLYETICHLCYVGLLQLGPRSFRDKDQLFMYLNSRASLYDTCSSKPGYHKIEDKKYKKIPFEFKTAKDVEIYWSEMLRICMNTQLGKRKIVDGQIVTIEECSAKPAMVDSLKAKSFDEAVANDTGKIPGDRRGSAGFDSSVWSFVKRNWVWNSKLINKGTRIQAAVTGLKKEKLDVLPAPIRYDLVVKGGPPDRKVYLKPKKKVVKMTELKKGSHKKIVRKIVARAKKKKVREYCDAIDRSIMRKNPGMKVEWDEEEDQFLRYCRIVSVFLCPESRKQFISYNVMRDVLHRVYPKSKNKTARAIQRRIYVMLTNDEVMKIMETNIENLLNSDTISKYLEQIHNRYKNGLKVTDPQLCIAFVYLLSYVCKHRKEVELLLLGYFASFDFFSDDNVCESEAVLQNCEDGNSPMYTNPKTVEDVTKDTIKSVIHCSMSCRKNSVGWTFHLSSIYKKFPDDLIRTIVSDLKKNQFLVRIRSLDGNKSLDNAWPIPIKFSHLYNLMKVTSYTTEMYREAYKHFVALIAQTSFEVGFIDCNEMNTFWEKTSFVFDIPEMGIILNPEIEDHSEVIEELAKRFRIYLDQICQRTNKVDVADKGNTNQSEKNLDETKDEVRHLVFRVPYLLEDKLETYFKKMLDSNSNLEINNYIFLMIVDLKKFAQEHCTTEDLKKFVDAVDESNGVDDQDKLVRNLSKVVFAIQNIHYTSSENLDDAFKSWQKEIWDEVRTKDDEEVSHKTLFSKNYASGMENCINRAQSGDFPSLEEIKEGIMAEVENSEERKIPHITDLIMLLNEDRFPELDTDVETIEKMKEHFVMQYPELSQFLIDDLEAMKDLEVTRKILDELKVERIKKKTENITKVPQMDHIVRYILSVNGTQEDIKATENLIDFIKEKKDLGASAKDLKTNFVSQFSVSLVDLLQFLTEISVILRTGVSSITYVYHEYQTEWLIDTFILTSKEREASELKKQEVNTNLKAVLGEKIESSDPRKVQLKPWTKLDGRLNDEVFHEWLCMVLSRCVDFPNIPFSVLCEHFHYVKPVDIYFLLEVLEDLGCVEIYLLDSVENSLFSSRCIVNECKATCLDSFEEMFVKPANVAGLCFGSFLVKDIV